MSTSKGRRINAERREYLRTGGCAHFPVKVLVKIPAPWFYILKQVFGNGTVESLITVMLKWGPQVRKEIIKFLSGPGDKFGLSFSSVLAEYLRDCNPMVLKSLVVAKPSLCNWLMRKSYGASSLYWVLTRSTEEFNSLVAIAPKPIRQGCHLSIAKFLGAYHCCKSGEFLIKRYSNSKTRLHLLSEAMGVEEGYAHVPSLRKQMELYLEVFGTPQTKRWSVKLLDQLFMYIRDGKRIVNVLLRNDYDGQPVRFPGSFVEDVRASIIAHRQYNEYQRKANAASFVDETPTWVPVDDLDQRIGDLADLRIKTTGAMRTIGMEQNHCLGSYAGSKSLFFFREGVAAQVSYCDSKQGTKWYVNQCYDYNNTMTIKSEMFAELLSRELVPKLPSLPSPASEFVKRVDDAYVELPDDCPF